MLSPRKRFEQYKFEQFKAIQKTFENLRDCPVGAELVIHLDDGDHTFKKTAFSPLPNK